MASSTRLRSVTSVSVPQKPVRFPCASWIGMPLLETQTTLPDLATMALTTFATGWPACSIFRPSRLNSSRSGSGQRS